MKQFIFKSVLQQIVQQRNFRDKTLSFGVDEIYYR